MKIKIAVTDACIFIDLYDLGLIAPFFKLEIEIHTTSAVYFELYEEQQQVLNAYQSVEKLIVHNLKEQDFIEIHSERMIWIFDKLVEANILKKRDAANKLKQLVATNFIFQNNKFLVDEIKKRLKIWDSN